MSNTDFSSAEWRPSPNYWNGFDKRDFIVIHATASCGEEYVPNFDASTGKSVHYAIAKDGHVVQYVREANSAWGNCCATGKSTFRQDYNWNKSTVSIENEKSSCDNSEPLTDAQYHSLLMLVRDIAQRWNIPLVYGQQGVRGIIYHHDLDPINKARCPGTFPYATFFRDLQGGPPMNGLPKGATDDGTTIHFPNGLVIVKGFRARYLEMAKAGEVPDDDEPLVNEYPCQPVEKSDPAWWGTSQTNKGSAQETRYFRFGYSPLKGVRVTYVGQELHWYQQQITSGAH